MQYLCTFVSALLIARKLSYKILFDLSMLYIYAVLSNIFSFSGYTC